MSVICEKCGADISYESETHPNCEKVEAYEKVLRELAKDWPHIGYAAQEVLERFDAAVDRSSNS